MTGLKSLPWRDFVLRGEMKRLKTLTKYLQCPECKKFTVIQRRIGRNKADGHVKHLYCPVCRKRTAHIEYSEMSYYMEMELIRKVIDIENKDNS